MSSVYKGDSNTTTRHEIYNEKVSSHHFYGHGGIRSEDSDNDSEGETILQRKRAWAELEREQEEIKRNIKSLMKTAPESRAIDDPMLADRVRGVRYEPVNYNHEDKIHTTEKQIEKKKSLESDKKKEEKK